MVETFETSLDAFKAKDTRFVADWLKSKGLYKLCSVLEGIHYVYICSFQSIIEATEKFPRGGGT